MNAHDIGYKLGKAAGEEKAALFGWLKRLFGGGAPKPKPAPVPLPKPAIPGVGSAEVAPSLLGRRQQIEQAQKRLFGRGR